MVVEESYWMMGEYMRGGMSGTQQYCILHHGSGPAFTHVVVFLVAETFDTGVKTCFQLSTHVR